MAITPSNKPIRNNRPVTIPDNMDQIIRPRVMAALTGRSLTSLWRDEKAGLIPKRLRIGAQATGWTKSQYEAWLASRQTA